MEMKEILRELTALYGPSGRETEVADWISRFLTDRGILVKRDALGNVVADLGGEGSPLVFASHMDSVGVMLCRIDEKGYGYFSAVGWLDAGMIAHQVIRFPNDVYAVAAIKDDKVGKELKLTDLYLDFGTGSRAETEKLVDIGAIGTFMPYYRESGDAIMASFLDNRAGCAILLAAVEKIKSPKHRVYLAFTVQEEVGTRGAGPAVWDLAGGYGIAVDVTNVDDVPGSIHDGTAILGKGAGIKILDHSALSRPMVIRAMEQTAKSHEIPVQKDIMPQGGTDAGAMAGVRTGMAVGGISLPCRYTHAPVEICNQKDLEACAALVAAMAETEI